MGCGVSTKNIGCPVIVRQLDWGMELVGLLGQHKEHRLPSHSPTTWLGDGVGGRRSWAAGSAQRTSVAQSCVYRRDPQGGSKNHVIHKVNFMVLRKVKRLMLPNILQSEQELHIWNPCQIACPSMPVLWILGHSFLIYEGSKVGNRARFCRNSQSLGGHISHTTGPIGLQFWIWCCGFRNNIHTKFH